MANKGIELERLRNRREQKETKPHRRVATTKEGYQVPNPTVVDNRQCPG